MTGSNAAGTSSAGSGGSETSAEAGTGDTPAGGSDNGEGGMNSGDMSSGGSGETSTAGATSAGFTDGPSAACLAAIAAFQPCGGELDGTWQVGDVSCSPSTDDSHGPGCATGGTMHRWFEGGTGNITFSGGGVSFDNTGAKLHVEGLAPVDCVKTPASQCASTYFAMPVGAPNLCTTVEGDNCHCNWVSPTSGIMGGGGGYTVADNAFTTVGHQVPYCVTGSTLTMDLSSAFPTMGTPFLVTATKQP